MLKASDEFVQENRHFRLANRASGGLLRSVPSPITFFQKSNEINPRTHSSQANLPASPVFACTRLTNQKTSFCPPARKPARDLLDGHSNLFVCADFHKHLRSDCSLDNRFLIKSL